MCHALRSTAVTPDNWTVATKEMVDITSCCTVMQHWLQVYTKLERKCRAEEEKQSVAARALKRLSRWWRGRRRVGCLWQRPVPRQQLPLRSCSRCAAVRAAGGGAGRRRGSCGTAPHGDGIDGGDDGDGDGDVAPAPAQQGPAAAAVAAAAAANQQLWCRGARRHRVAKRRSVSIAVIGDAVQRAPAFTTPAAAGTGAGSSSRRSSRACATRRRGARAGNRTCATARPQAKNDIGFESPATATNRQVPYAS